MDKVSIFPTYALSTIDECTGNGSLTENVEQLRSLTLKMAKVCHKNGDVLSEVSAKLDNILEDIIELGEEIRSHESLEETRRQLLQSLVLYG